jgi:hypothetical protein
MAKSLARRSPERYSLGPNRRPAGTTLVGVAAAGAGVGLRYLTREEARDERASG